MREEKGAVINIEDVETEKAVVRTVVRRNATGSAGVVGLGYVGLPTSVAAATAGWRVIGFDIDPGRVDALNRGESHVSDVPDETLSALLENGRFAASGDLSRIADCDVVLICVPTPINRAKEPDLGAVTSAARAVGQWLRNGQLIILESTTYPGTTVEVVKPLLEAGGLKAGQDFMLAFAPERLEPGNMRFKLAEIPKVVGGFTDACTKAAAAFYGTFIDRVVPVSSPNAAEMVKIYENVFRCVNIAFVNELALLCNRMGLDVWEVIDAASTKPYGFMPFYPGPGLGGHCIPVDPHYLAWKARQYDFHVRFVELAASINDHMPYFVCERVASVLNERRKCLNGSRLLILGVTYKRDVADLRESPALRIIELLSARGAEVSYNDPFIPSLVVSVNGREIALESLPLSANTLRAADCCVIVTDHSAYDWQLVTDHAPLIVDSRNALKHTPAAHAFRL